MARGAATQQRAVSASAHSATGTETLSLVEDSGASDDGLSGPEGGAKRGRSGKEKGKGKDGAKKARRPRRAQDEGEDEDDVVVVGSSSRAHKNGKGKAASTSSKAKGKKRAASPAASDSDDDAAGSSAPSTPRTPVKRRSTTRRSAAASKHDAVVDLTESPPRKKKKKKGDKGKDKPVGGASGIITAGHAFSDERRAARDKAKKREAPEARWPTQEEHEGCAAGAVAVSRGGESSGAAQGASDARWARREAKGKGRAMDVDDEDEPGGTFLDDLHAALAGPLEPSTSAAAPLAPVYSRRALSLIPDLLPPFSPHSLLDRLAAPMRNASSSTSSPSTFVRPTDRDYEPGEDDVKLWTAKYGPQSADEVLGDVSGQSARWLRDWLEELKVQGAAGDADAARRRRPIARGLIKPKKKAKKRKPFNDFIALSDDEDDDAPATYPSSSYDARASDFGDDDDDDDDLLLLPSSSASRRAGSVFPNLTNLILLHGPHGTGKSAAVHAVASELNFEVFEVFPGMGRRSAKDLERYVGDVGRNHVVLGGSPRKGGQGGAAGGSVAAMFKRLQAKVEAGPVASGSAHGAKGKEKEKETGAEVRDKGPTQSLILVDEVDVLFRGDEDFWQGLISLAQQSRRPIVMTCTNFSNVPFDELGLQQVVTSATTSPANFLSFAAPSPDVAVPYLQLVGLREGHILPSSTVDSLYSAFSRSRPYPAWLTQQEPGERPLPHPLSSMPLPSDDLRKALMQLQFECAWGVPGATSGEESDGALVEDETAWCEGALRVPISAEGDDGRSGTQAVLNGTTGESDGAGGRDGKALERAALAADALSFADAHVARRISALIEDEETGRFITPGDAEASFPVLEYVLREDTQRIPFVGAEPDMVQAIDSLAFGLWEGVTRFGPLEDEELESKRSDFTFRLGQLVHSGGDNALLQPPDPILPSSSVTTDYRPYLRSITLADDDRLAASAFASASAADDGGPSEVHALGMAASLAAAAGPGGAGARKQRKSARQKAQKGEPMYERVLGWASEVEADWLRASGFE
ncbi:hypothetical protein JCM3775_004340 [Rhodotorula graminis]